MWVWLLALESICNQLVAFVVQNRLCSTGHLATPPIEITFDVEHLEMVAKRCQVSHCSIAYLLQTPLHQEYKLEVEEYMKKMLRKQEEEVLYSANGSRWKVLQIINKL